MLTPSTNVRQSMVKYFFSSSSPLFFTLTPLASFTFTISDFSSSASIFPFGSLFPANERDLTTSMVSLAYTEKLRSSFLINALRNRTELRRVDARVHTYVCVCICIYIYIYIYILPDLSAFQSNCQQAAPRLLIALRSPELSCTSPRYQEEQTDRIFHDLVIGNLRITHVFHSRKILSIARIDKAEKIGHVQDMGQKFLPAYFFNKTSRRKNKTNFIKCIIRKDYEFIFSSSFTFFRRCVHFRTCVLLK